MFINTLLALAEWYYSNRKYKLSSIYYQEANRYENIYRKIKNGRIYNEKTFIYTFTCSNFQWGCR